MELKTALVVDDSKVARFGLTKILENKGIQVETVTSGIEAISYLEQQHPDIIFMDYFMPGMDGPDATRAIRENQNTANIPIVMCTSKEAERDQVQAKSAGADGFIIKPATRKALDQVLEDIKMQHYKIKTRSPLEPLMQEQDSDIQVLEPPEKIASVTHVESDPMPAIPIHDDRFESNVSEFIQRIAQETVKKLADALVPEMAETTATVISEDISRALNHELNQEIKSECTELARSIAASTAQDLTQELAKQIAHNTAEKVANDVAETITIDSIKTLEKSIDGSIAYSLQQLVHNDEITEQLKEITHHHSVSVAESVARNIAGEIADQTAREIALLSSEEIAERIVRQQLKTFKMVMGTIVGFLTILVTAMLVKMF